MLARRIVQVAGVVVALALAIAVVIKWAPVSAPTLVAGYAELALSDIPLLWMVKHVRDVGWAFKADCLTPFAHFPPSVAFTSSLGRDLHLAQWHYHAMATVARSEGFELPAF